MTARRVSGILAIAMAAIGGIAVMVGYTKRVETSLRKPPASRSSVRLLKDRAEIPPLTGIDLDGRSVSTAALRGRVVRVTLWAPWSPPCRQETRDLTGLQTRYKHPLQTIGIARAWGSIDIVTRFAVQQGMNYPTTLSSPDIERLFPPV